MAASINWTKFRAVLFDLDGVVTPTATVHERAWSELFAEFGFTGDDYLTYVDGKPRYDGVQSFLRSRGVDLPWGEPTDPPGTDTVCAMGNRKNDTFNAVLDRDGIAPYPGTLTVLDLLESNGIDQAIVSSSKNARKVLDVAGLTHRFPVVVDGTTAAAEGLPGKPRPDMFLRAAELVGTGPAEAIVVEDATSGVAAAAAGGFGLVLGIDRGQNLLALLASGADVVVEDLVDTIRPEQLEPRTSGTRA
jgi:beta-phosphoglucomutase family hydrolase